MTNYQNSWNGKTSILFENELNIDVLLFYVKTNYTGSVWVNKSKNDFNQTIPTTIINLLFDNPTNLSNLHQSWFMDKTENSTSNFDVAVEIYLASMQRNFSYVNHMKQKQ